MSEQIPATRMELRKLKTKRKTAQKGHQLLKEKTNQLIKSFYDLAVKTKNLRSELCQAFKRVLDQYQSSQATLTPAQINLLFAMPNRICEYDFGQTSIMSVDVPQIECICNEKDARLPYSPYSANTRYDKAIGEFYQLYPQLLELAKTEKSLTLLAREIEKCRRRVNALEGVIIPKYDRQIAQIIFALGEQERSNTARLIKIKKDKF